MNRNSFETVRQMVVGSVRAIALTALVTASALAQDDGGRIYGADELTALPTIEAPERAARVIKDSYPRALLSRGIGGSVRLRFVIEPDGTVDRTSIEVVAATIRRLGEAAKDAIRRVKFTPAQVDGRAVRTLIEFPVVYRSQ